MAEYTEFAIGSDYRIRWDGAHNWVAERRVTRKHRSTGEEYEDFETLSYDMRLQDAARRLYREELKGKGQQNMKGMADLILQMEAKLEKAVVAALTGRESA